VSRPALLTGPKSMWLPLLWLPLLCLALLARALVPAGWMPAADAHGIRLALCSGWVVSNLAPSAAPAHHADQVHAAAAAHPTDGEHHSDQSSKHSVPCTFAASALGVTLPPDVVAPASGFLPEVVLAPLLLARIGQGLVAPPPPSTGPPHHS